MQSYIAKRLLMMFPVLIGASILVFAIIHLAPGNPAYTVAGPDASAEAIKAIEVALGLDRPVHEQYLRWASRAIAGDLGVSIRTRAPVAEEILDRLPNTIALAIGSITLGVILGIIIGIMSAVFRGRLLDKLVMFFAILGISSPSFVRALLIMWVFAVHLGWFPISGKPDVSLLSPVGLRYMALPILTLSVHLIATLSRLTRSTLLEVLSEDYIRTARAKGLSERVVMLKHALRNAMLPVLTVIGFQVGFMLGGAIITETVFAWPGVGRLLIGAINGRDFPVVQGIILMIATAYVIVNLLVDLGYVALDPRIRYA